jgi:hypothetical protein
MADEQPIEEEYRSKMNALAVGIDKILNGDDLGKERKVGFLLGVFEFGDLEGGRFNYISNANRSDIINLLKEMTAKFQGQPDVTGHA